MHRSVLQLETNQRNQPQRVAPKFTVAFQARHNHAKPQSCPELHCLTCRHRNVLRLLLQRPADRAGEAKDNRPAMEDRGGADGRGPR